MQGIDYTNQTSDSLAQTLAADGYGFVARYLVPERSWKHMSRAEAEAVSNAGMLMVSVYETTADRPKGGAAAGAHDGQVACECAKNVGQPEGSAIYFAVDYDASMNDMDSIEAYLLAAAEQLPGYTVGVYGCYKVIEQMAARGACQNFWQTFAWSRGKKSTYANIYQYTNDESMYDMSIDRNESYGNEGAWTTLTTQPVQAVEPPLPEPAKPNTYPCGVVMNDAPAAFQGFTMDDGHSYLPIRAVAEAIGSEVGWDNEAHKAILWSKTLDSTLVIGDKGYAWSKEIADVIGYYVFWDNGNVILTGPVAIAANEVVVANGYVRNGTSYSPIRAVAEALGATVGWNQESQAAIVSGQEVATIVYNNAGYASSRELAAAIGANVTWENNTVKFTK